MKCSITNILSWFFMIESASQVSSPLNYVNQY
jgi:hypothetical protein